MDSKQIVKALRKAGRNIAGKKIDAQISNIETLCKQWRDAQKAERKQTKSVDRGDVTSSLDRGEG